MDTETLTIANAYLPRIAAAQGLLLDSADLDKFVAKAPISAIADMFDTLAWWRNRMRAEARALFVELDLLPSTQYGRDTLETMAHELQHRSCFFARALEQTGIRAV